MQQNAGGLTEVAPPLLMNMHHIFVYCYIFIALINQLINSSVERKSTVRSWHKNGFPFSSW